MTNNIAIVRRELEKHPKVTRTWFEWDLEGGHQLKTLVIEAAFDADPNSPDFSQAVLDRIERIAKGGLANTTMNVTHIRIVPKGVY